MRISTRMFQEGALRSLRGNLETLSRLQEQVATGRRVNKVSDDPGAATQIMRTQAQIRDAGQYRSNGTEAATRMNTEDAVLTSASKLLEQARELALGVADRAPSDPERQSMVNSIHELRQQLISLGNTRVGNEYIFGGTSTAVPAFTASGAYDGTGTMRTTEIDHGVMVATNHTGARLFSSALQHLDDLEAQLGGGTKTGINSAVTALQNDQSSMTAAQSETGARLQQIESTGTLLADRMSKLMDRRDSLRNVDATEASVNLVSAQSALERAYAAVSKVLSTNLLDYLR
jgi:flagellar hook-associated protein 3 FlgL